MNWFPSCCGWDSLLCGEGCFWQAACMMLKHFAKWACRKVLTLVPCEGSTRLEEFCFGEVITGTPWWSTHG